MGVKLNFFKIPVNVDILTSSSELWIFFMAATVVDPFQSFQLTLSRSIRGTPVCGNYVALQNVLIK